MGVAHRKGGILVVGGTHSFVLDLQLIDEVLCLLFRLQCTLYIISIIHLDEMGKALHSNISMHGVPHRRGVMW